MHNFSLWHLNPHGNWPHAIALHGVQSLHSLHVSPHSGTFPSQPIVSVMFAAFMPVVPLLQVLSFTHFELSALGLHSLHISLHFLQGAPPQSGGVTPPGQSPLILTVSSSLHFLVLPQPACDSVGPTFISLHGSQSPHRVHSGAGHSHLAGSSAPGGEQVG